MVTHGVSGVDEQWLLDSARRGDEAAYRAVALFDVASYAYQSHPGDADWRFLVGRWTALIAAFGAAIFAIGAVLRERAAQAAARLMRQAEFEQHVGSQNVCSSIAEALDRAKREGKVRFVGFTGHKNPEVHLDMVRRGYAIAYLRYSSKYEDAEIEARTAKRGIWQGAFQEPERWRREHLP